MKKITFILLVLIAISCNKKIGQDPIGEPPGGTPYNPPTPPTTGTGTGGFVVITTCNPQQVNNPTIYTPTNNIENIPKGFGLFADVNYDKGWKEGYKDAIFYHNYYQVYTNPAKFCSLEMKQGVSDATKPGGIRYESADYTLKTGEISMGIYIKAGACPGVDFIVKKCILWNTAESKSLRLQYEFNANYSGYRTQQQEQFDKGRYDGFVRGVTQEPFKL